MDEIIARTIRESTAYGEILTLPAPCLDQPHHEAAPATMPASAAASPLTLAGDVKRGVGVLLTELHAASKRLDHRSCERLKCALRALIAASRACERESPRARSRSEGV